MIEIQSSVSTSNAACASYVEYMMEKVVTNVFEHGWMKFEDSDITKHGAATHYAYLIRYVTCKRPLLNLHYSLLSVSSNVPKCLSAAKPSNSGASKLSLPIVRLSSPHLARNRQFPSSFCSFVIPHHRQKTINCEDIYKAQS